MANMLNVTFLEAYVSHDCSEQNKLVLCSNVAVELHLANNGTLICLW